MNNDEILLIQNYLRDIFDNEEISIRKEQEVPPIAKFFLGKEAIGFLKKDDDSDEDEDDFFKARSFTPMTSNRHSNDPRSPAKNGLTASTAARSCPSP